MGTGNGAGGFCVLFGRSELRLELMEERGINAVRFHRRQAEFEVFEHCDKLFAIDQLNRRNPIAERLTFRVSREGPRREDDALVGPPHHGTAEIPYLTRTHRTRVPLALKENLETDQRIDLQDPDTVNTAVVRFACDCHLLKSGLAQ